MKRAFQEFDLAQSSKLPPQNRVRVPGPLMSRTRCVVCGKAISGATGGLQVEVHDNVITSAKAYHDIAYGPCHERKEYTDPRSLVTYRRLDLCCDRIERRIPTMKIGVNHSSYSCWRVEGDFKTVLEYIERKVAKLSTGVDDIFKEHRARLKVLTTGGRKHKDMVSRFMDAPREPYGGRAKIVRLIGAVQDLKESLFKRKDGQTFVVIVWDQSLTDRFEQRRILHPIPKTLYDGLRQYGTSYKKIIQSIGTVHSRCDLERVTALLNKLLDDSMVAASQWERLAILCDEIPAGCSTQDVLSLLEHAVGSIIKPIHGRRI